MSEPANDGSGRPHDRVANDRVANDRVANDRVANGRVANSRVPIGTIHRSAFWWNVSKYLVLVFSRLWFRLRIDGRANVPRHGPLLIVSNHSSYLDPPMIGISAGRWVGFLAQAGLGKLGPLRWWLAQVGVTLIDRNAPSKDAMRLIADCLLRGEAVGIFPEGTRSADGAVAPFRTGVEFLVRRTGAPVVPVGIEGAFRAFPRGAILPRPRKVIVRYGAPWSADRVLAPGGIDALRACIGQLAGAPLRERDDAARRRSAPAAADGTDPKSPTSSSAGSEA